MVARAVFTSPNSMVFVRVVGDSVNAPVPASIFAPLGLKLFVRNLIGPLPVVATVFPLVSERVGASTVRPAPARVLVACSANVMAPPVEVTVVNWFMVTASL